MPRKPTAKPKLTNEEALRLGLDVLEKCRPEVRMIALWSMLDRFASDVDPRLSGQVWKFYPGAVPAKTEDK